MMKTISVALALIFGFGLSAMAHSPKKGHQEDQPQITEESTKIETKIEKDNETGEAVETTTEETKTTEKNTDSN